MTLLSRPPSDGLFLNVEASAVLGLSIRAHPQVGDKAGPPPAGGGLASVR
jgi:hypothetical protein